MRRVRFTRSSISRVYEAVTSGVSSEREKAFVENSYEVGMSIGSGVRYMDHGGVPGVGGVAAGDSVHLSLRRSGAHGVVGRAPFPVSETGRKGEVMKLYRIQRQSWEADIMRDPWETVATLTCESAADRLLDFMHRTWPEYGWSIRYDRTEGL